MGSEDVGLAVVVGPHPGRACEPERACVSVASERPHVSSSVLAAERHLRHCLPNHRPRNDRVRNRPFVDVVQTLSDQLLQDSRAFPHVAVIGITVHCFSRRPSGSS